MAKKEIFGHAVFKGLLIELTPKEPCKEILQAMQFLRQKQKILCVFLHIHLQEIERGILDKIWQMIFSIPLIRGSNFKAKQQI